jgi:hypothetical protein
VVLSIVASQQQRVVNDRSWKCDASCKSVCGGSVEGRAKKATSREREREEKVRVEESDASYSLCSTGHRRVQF